MSTLSLIKQYPFESAYQVLKLARKTITDSNTIHAIFDIYNSIYTDDFTGLNQIHFEVFEKYFMEPNFTWSF